MAPINLFDLYAKIALDDSEYSQGVEKAISSSKDVKKAVESLSSPLNKVQQNFNAIRHPIETAREGFNNLKDATESIRHPIETIRNKISDASNALETQKNVKGITLVALVITIVLNFSYLEMARMNRFEKI